MEWIILAMLGKTLSVVLNIPHDWLICSVVLLSMLLQVLLIFVGGIRYRFAKWILSFVSWISYLSADYVAIYALGLMLHSSRHEVGILYAVWAPLLLVHLGGPDTITAYSMTDNELWKRHALVMVYHLCVAAYLICVSMLPLSLEGQTERSLLVAAIFIYFAGATKYFERTMALRFASIPQLVSSTLPIDTFMQIEHKIGEGGNEYNYIVSGERKFFQEHTRKMDSFRKSEENSSMEGDNIQKSEEKLPKEGDTIQKSEETKQGESFEEKQEKFLKENFSKQKLNEMGVVTVADVWEWEGKRATQDYMLCVSHALFKSYMRRFGGLPFPEGNQIKTKEFFYTHLRAEKVFKVVERELKFTYDYLFSKSSRTSFSRLGTAMRFLNTGLLAVAWFQVYNTLVLLEEKQGHSNRAQRVVTYILLYVAVVLEMFQLCRIMLSDWTRVWLVCANIRLSRRRRSRCPDACIPMLKSALLYADTCVAMLIKSAFLVAKCVQKLFLLGLKQEYWQNQIQQYSLIGTCLTCSAGIEKVRCLTCTSTSKDKSLTSKAKSPACIEKVLLCFSNCKDNRSGCTGKALCLTCTSNCTRKGPAKRKRKGRKSNPAILRWYIKAVAVRHMKPKPIDEELRDFILRKIEEYCYEKKNDATLPSRLLNSINKDIYKQVGVKQKLNTETWEREILKWHVTTAICQGHDQDARSENPPPAQDARSENPDLNPDLSVDSGLGFFDWNVNCVSKFLFYKKNRATPAAADPAKKNMRVSETLSNYCGYLLVSYPSMLPLHPDMAKLEHEKLLLEIVPLVLDMKKKKAEEAQLWDNLKVTTGGSSSTLTDAAALAEKLMQKKAEERWELISRLWSVFLLYYAYFYKSTFHGGSLAAGGEYISQLWALLAHLGFGEQSDTAVGHRGGSDKPPSADAKKDIHPAPAQQTELQPVETEAVGEIQEEKEDQEIKEEVAVRVREIEEEKEDREIKEEVAVGVGEIEEEMEDREIKEGVGVGEIEMIGSASAQPPDLEKGEFTAKQSARATDT